MKTLLLFLFISAPLFSQTYINILYTDAGSGYADVDNITDITFNAAGTKTTATLNCRSVTEQKNYC